MVLHISKRSIEPCLPRAWKPKRKLLALIKWDKRLEGCEKIQPAKCHTWWSNQGGQLSWGKLLCVCIQIILHRAPLVALFEKMDHEKLCKEKG